jgi:hypothetical protein
MVWRGCVYVAGTVGMLCAYTEWGWNGVAISLMLALVAGAVGATVWAGSERGGAARVAWLTVGAGLLVAASVGLIAVLHVVGLCVVLLLAILSPGLGARVLHAASARGPARGPGGTGSVRPPSGDDFVERRSLPPLQDVATLDDEALCLAWRRSHLSLTMSRSTSERLSVIEHRTRILDEVARRSPDALAVWWTAGGLGQRATGIRLRRV